MVKVLAVQALEPELGSPESMEKTLGCGASPIIPALEGGDRGPTPHPSKLTILAMSVNSRFE